MLAALRSRSFDEKGFTLVELLVVIIIIGILAAIAVPVFLNQRKRANDATLKSDTKNIAQELTGWFGEQGGRDVNTLYTITGQTHPTQLVLGVYGAGKAAANPINDWNQHSPLPRLNASPGNQITISMNRQTTGNYTRHESGDFCLSSNHDNSNYNYATPGFTGGSNYHKLLFFDVQLGGLVEMDAIVSAIQAGQPSSCSHFGKVYMSARGIPIP